jgi:glycosyltransferase involved in cell wall biosynthesis
MKVAIVYDWIDKQGGVERLLLILSKKYPEADFFTSMYDPEAAPWAKDLKIHTSFMNTLPGIIKKSRILSSKLFPYAFESFDFTGYDLVISVTSSFAKGIITRPETKHICILLTPTRYIWGLKDSYKRSEFFNMMAAPALSKLRKWDFIAAQRPDRIIAISELVADRCDKDYNREAQVIYPPIDTEYWMNLTPELVEIPQDYYLVVSRLEPYKRIELVVEAFRLLPDQKCIIVGKGSELSNLKMNAGSNVTFLPDISDAKLAYLLQHAKALLMPQEEDFGYTALEALIFDCPVITYKDSGAAEIVQEGKTGKFIDTQTVESVRKALERFPSVPYNVASYKKGILDRFSISRFYQQLDQII